MVGISPFPGSVFRNEPPNLGYQQTYNTVYYGLMKSFSSLEFAQYWTLSVRLSSSRTCCSISLEQHRRQFENFWRKVWCTRINQRYWDSIKNTIQNKICKIICLRRSHKAQCHKLVNVRKLRMVICPVSSFFFFINIHIQRSIIAFVVM